MRNIVLDLIMGIICIVCIISMFGIFVLEDVPKAWKDMRK
jgi:hypothetical protein